MYLPNLMTNILLVIFSHVTYLVCYSSRVFYPTMCVNLLCKHLKMSCTIRLKPIDFLLLAVAMVTLSIRAP